MLISLVATVGCHVLLTGLDIVVALRTGMAVWHIFGGFVLQDMVSIVAVTGATAQGSARGPPQSRLDEGLRPSSAPPDPLPEPIEGKFTFGSVGENAERRKVFNLSRQREEPEQRQEFDSDPSQCFEQGEDAYLMAG